MSRCLVQIAVGTLFFPMIACPSLAQGPDSLWMRTYGWGGDEGVSPGDMGFSCDLTSDGGCIITGIGHPVLYGGSDLCLIRTDDEGNVLWDTFCCGPGKDRGYSVEQTTDGGFIAVGYRDMGYGCEYDVLLTYEQPGGHVGWNHTYGGPDYDWGHCVRQAADGGYIVAGETESFGAGDSDVWLIRTNSDGDTLWTKTYGGGSHDEARSVSNTEPDGGYIITGFTHSEGRYGRGLFLIKTDSNGDTLWTRTYGIAGISTGECVIQCADGGYAVCADITRGGPWSYGDRDIFVLKTDTLGDTLWTRSYGGCENEYASDMQQTPDGGFVIVGTTESFGAGSWDVYLLRLGAFGDTLWSKTYGGTRQDWGAAVRRTPDGCYVMTGYTASFGTGTTDVYLIKTERDPCWSEVVPCLLAVSEAAPNPFGDATSFVIDLRRAADVTISLYDVNGRLFGLPVVMKVGSGREMLMLDVTGPGSPDLSPGVYFCCFAVEDTLTARKLVFVK